MKQFNTIVISIFLTGIVFSSKAFPSFKFTPEQVRIAKFSGGAALVSAAIAITGGYIWGKKDSEATLKLKELEKKQQADREARLQKQKEEARKVEQDQAAQRFQEVASFYKTELSQTNVEGISEENLELIIKRKYNGKQFPYYTYYKKLPEDIVQLKKLALVIPSSRKADLDLLMSVLEKFHEKTNEHFGKHIRLEKAAVQERREREAQQEFESNKRKLDLESARLQIQNRTNKNIVLTDLRQFAEHAKEQQAVLNQAINEIRSNQNALDNNMQSVTQAQMNALNGIAQRIDTLERKVELQGEKNKLTAEQQTQKVIKHITETKKEMEKRREEQEQQQPPATFQSHYPQAATPSEIIAPAPPPTWSYQNAQTPNVPPR